MTFEVFFRQYYSVMVSRARMKAGDLYAEDVVAETFVLLWRKWDKIEPHSEGVLLAWFYRALELKLKEHNRQYIPPLPLNDDLLPQADDRVSDPFDGQEDRIAEIRSQLTCAEDEAFDCLIMREMTYKETAKKLGISEAAVRVRWMRTRDRIKIILKKL